MELRSLLTGVLFLFCNFAWADFMEPVAPKAIAPGEYRFIGEYHVVQSSIREIVDAKYQAGQNRLLELRSQQYFCDPKPNRLFICDKFMPLEMSEAMSQKILLANHGVAFEFERSVGEPALLENNSAYNMWLVRQAVVLPGISVDKYRIYQRPGFLSAWFSETEPKRYLEIAAEDRLEEQASYRESHGVQTWIFLVNLHYNRMADRE